jgi:hypothetical protein
MVQRQGIMPLGAVKNPIKNKKKKMLMQQEAWSIIFETDIPHIFNLHRIFSARILRGGGGGKSPQKNSNRVLIR